ncbi:hypothetical protein HK101_004639, partial [Irineochytrium annulatum]
MLSGPENAAAMQIDQPTLNGTASTRDTAVNVDATAEQMDPPPIASAPTPNSKIDTPGTTPKVKPKTPRSIIPPRHLTLNIHLVASPAPVPTKISPKRAARLHVKVDFNLNQSNIFNCLELMKQQRPDVLPTPPKQRHKKKSNPAPATASTSGADAMDTEASGLVEGGSDGNSSENEDGHDAPTKRRVIHPEDVYDLEDDFIDDAEMYYTEGGYIPASTSNYGFFIWKGPIENYFEEFAADDLFEEPKAPPPKKKKTTTATTTPRKRTTAAKPATATATPSKPSATTAPTTAPPTTTAPATNAASTVPKPTAKRRSVSNSVAPLPPQAPSVAHTQPHAQQIVQGIPATAWRESAAALGLRASDVLMQPPTTPIPTLSAAGASAAFSTTSAPASALLGMEKERKRKNRKSDTGEEGDDESRRKREKKEKKRRKEDEAVAAAGLVGGTVLSVAPVTAAAAVGPAAFAEDVKAKIAVLREQAKRESFAEKRHFPPTLKPLLSDAAATALRRRQLGMGFVKAVKEFLPYNSFTLKKLISKMIIPDGVMELRRQIDVLLEETRVKVQEACLAQGIIGAHPGPSAGAATPGANGNGDAPAAAAETKKFKWTEELKIALWNLQAMEIEVQDLFAQYHTLEAMDEKRATDMAIRKTLYAKLLPFWPPGWVHTNDFSGQYSSYKRKIANRLAVLDRDGVPHTEAADLRGVRTPRDLSPALEA